MVTIDDARDLAKKILESNTKVHRIELFGIVVKNGQGNDADLILVVDEEISHQFWTKTANTGSPLPIPPIPIRNFAKKIAPPLERFFLKNKRARQTQASQLLNIDFKFLGKEYGSDLIVDPWLMPENWPTRIQSLTRSPNMRKVLAHAASHLIRLA